MPMVTKASVTTAVGYARVSTKAQGESGLSLSTQESAIRAYALSHKVSILTVYTEIETGTNKRQRPVLAAAVKHARTCGASLIVASLDRLTRSVTALRTIVDSGIDVICLDALNVDRAMLTIRAVFAELEAERIATRIRNVSAARRERGEVLGNLNNLTDTGRAKGADANRAKAIERHALAAAYANELRNRGLSLRAIASKLIVHGYGEYTATGIARILKRNEISK